MQIIGSGGGKSGGGGGGISEDPDTLSSLATARIVDLIGEGPIEGLVNGEFSIYLDGVPLRDIDGTANYRPFNWQWTPGTQSQQPIPGFLGTEQENSVGLQIHQSEGKVIRSIPDATADSVRVTLAVNGLTETTAEGKVQGSEVKYKLWARVAAGAWSLVFDGSISGKTGSRYQRSHEIKLEQLGPGPYEVAVERVSSDAVSALIVNSLFWDSYAVINYELFSYPNSALVATAVDGRYFSQIPQRQYHVKGLIVRVPANYDPIKRTYATTGPGTTGGGWDGTWKSAWTNNPAWCFYDLVTNTRYGLGTRISDAQISKWEMYKIAKYCDGMVPSGLTNNVFDYVGSSGISSGGNTQASVPIATGNLEPRFTLNVVINTREDAYKVLNNLASVFRGMAYWSSGMVTLTQDSPGDPQFQWTNANVTDGVFNYEGSGRSQRHTVATVGWNDPSESFTQKFEYVEDREGIARYGVRPIDIVAFGCTSRGQARRVGLWLLYTERVEKGAITFKAGLDSATVRPGAIGKILDAHRAGARWGGRVISSTTTDLTMDAPLALTAGTYELSVMMKDGTLVERTVTIGADGTFTTLTVGTAFVVAPAPMAIWTLSSSTLTQTLVRVVNVRQEGSSVFEITALEHEPSKYAAIEEGLPIEQHDHTILSLSGVYKVSNLLAEENTYRPDVDVSVRANVDISWDSPINAPVRGYLVRMVSKGQTYEPGETSSTSVTIPGVPPGQYTVSVRVVDVLGRIGPIVSTTVTVDGVDLIPPPDVTGFAGSVVSGGVKVSWDPCTVTDYAETELRLGSDWDSGTLLFVGKANYWIALSPPEGTYTLWAKHRDFSGNESENATDLIYEVILITGGSLILQVDRFPFFSFGSSTSHTAIAPGDTPITFTAKLTGTTGVASFTAEAFTARTGGTSLGTFTLGGSGNSRTMTAAQFVSLGTSGSVRRVRVTASLGGATDFIDVFRQDPSTTDPYLFLSNPAHSVPTDENGLFGDYSDATTAAVVYEGTTDTTPDWTFSKTADAGMTATINGGAGPVANPATVTVAVTDMTIPTGIVLITATQTGETDLTAEFVVDKQEASTSGYTAVWSPRSEIQLPLSDTGAVLSYADAWSELKIIRNGKTDDTANWTLTKQDVNVTSTLTGARVDVTSFVDPGAVGARETLTIPNAATVGWSNQYFDIAYADGVFLAYHVDSAGTWTGMLRSTDYETWTVVNASAAGRWALVAHDQGSWVLADTGSGTGHVGTVQRSTDGGLTWGPVSLPSTIYTPTRLAAGGGKLLLAGGTTSGYQSSNGGASWSAITFPGAQCQGLYYVLGTWYYADWSATAVYRSTNGGSSWTDETSDWPLESGYLGTTRLPARMIEFKGRAIAVCYLLGNKARYRDPGGKWITVTLPITLATYPELIIVGEVLWMVVPATVSAYTLDGKTWYASENINPVSYEVGVITSESLDIGYLPTYNRTTPATFRFPLESTSGTDGGVVVTATKAGAADIEAVLPVLKGTTSRDAYAFSANPAYLVLQATSDGVVKSFANATMNFAAQKNGVDDTANWTWTWTTTNLTPSSGTGPSITITGMTQSADVGYITVTFSKAGQAVQTETLAVQKVRGSLPAGPGVGGAFAAVSSTTTHITLRFKSDGRVQVRKTSGGTFTELTTWTGLISSSNSTYWIKVIPAAGTHALVSGTENTWLAMTSDRDYVMEDATSGVHVYNFDILFATDNAGTGETIGFGSMKLIVP